MLILSFLVKADRNAHAFICVILYVMAHHTHHQQQGYAFANVFDVISYLSKPCIAPLNLYKLVFVLVLETGNPSLFRSCE